METKDKVIEIIANVLEVKPEEITLESTVGDFLLIWINHLQQTVVAVVSPLRHVGRYRLVRHNHRAGVFVTDYPKEIKSFYMKQNADGKTVAAADMLVPGIGELIGGSQREEDYDKLVTRMDELGLDKSSYDWYLNLRKFGGVEHAGYGLGFERMIMYLTGIQNIRDVLPFPRTAYGF